MENTLENKSKFFALYWGQMVGINSSWSANQGRFIVNQFSIGHLGNSNILLELKPLSSISEGDALEVSKLCVHGDNKRVDNIKSWARIYAMQSSLINDYLRSKGYALPWMGLSVEKQIEYGWVKLEKEANHG